MGSNLVLIDTSVWILALRKSPPPAVKDEVAHLLAENRAAIVPLIRLELLGGTKSLNEFNRLNDRLSALHQISADEANWETAIQLAFKLRQRGKIIPYTDIIIASAAIINNCTLLHCDKHFDLMAENTDLKVKSLISILR
jgi:predicted nucleic acid-binding protein